MRTNPPDSSDAAEQVVFYGMSLPPRRPTTRASWSSRRGVPSRGCAGRQRRPGGGVERASATENDKKAPRMACLKRVATR